MISDVRQIDFICIDLTAFKLVLNAGTTDDLSIGVDHKAVRMILTLHDFVTFTKKAKMKKRRNKCGKRWKPADPTMYAADLDRRLEDHVLADSLDEKVQDN